MSEKRDEPTDEKNLIWKVVEHIEELSQNAIDTNEDLQEMDNNIQEIMNLDMGSRILKIEEEIETLKKAFHEHNSTLLKMLSKEK